MREIGFFDDGVGPDALHQFFFSQHVTAVLDKHQEHFESLGCERYDLVAAQQQALAGIQPVRSEFENMIGLLSHVKAQRVATTR